MSAERLTAVDAVIAQVRGLSPTFDTVRVLAAVIATALRIPPPRGDIAVIRAQHDAYTAAESTAKYALGTFRELPGSMPEVWRGSAAQSAGEMLNALAMQMRVVELGFHTGAAVLDTWCEQLVKARGFDGDGRDQLRAARKRLSQVSFFHGNPGGAIRQRLVEALKLTVSGCQALRAGAKLEDDAGRDAAMKLRLSALQARGRQFSYTGASGLDSIVLAYEGASILTPAAVGHISELLAAMNDKDRAAFDVLVKGAGSATEVIYLWKALGAGYTTGQLAEFDRIIRPHAGDAVWLQQHLSPNVRGQQFDTRPDAGKRIDVSYFGKQQDSDSSSGLVPFYSQGDDPTCVAASDTVARLDMDPVLMLGVTTGTGPAAVAGAAVGEDTSSAVRARVQQLYSQNHHTAQAADGGMAEWGVGGRGADALNASLLSPVTGQAYYTTSLDSPEARRAALPHIQAAAAAGNPVPFTVSGPQTDIDRVPGHRQELTSETVRHQMIVVDARDDRLEVYNPWGYTQWVSTEDFVDNRLGEVTGVDPRDGMPNVVSASIPSDEAAHHGVTDR